MAARPFPLEIAIRTRPALAPVGVARRIRRMGQACFVREVPRDKRRKANAWKRARGGPCDPQEDTVVIRKLLSLAAVALTAVMLLPSEPADARPGVRGGGGFRAVRVVRGPVYRPRVVVRRPIVVHRPVRIIRRGYIAPVVVTGGCEWLRRRALLTGSRYWWRRYYACRGW
jgi:hypothetical protein